MQKLFPTEPEITLYQDGFEKLTVLRRQRQGAQLTELMDKTSDSFTIAVNGAWGTGKTVFLKCWVGHHLKNSAHDPIVVYFDAFEHDYQDDPLIALTSAIAERLENETKSNEGKSRTKAAYDKVKAAAPILGRGLFRTVTSMATAGLVANADQLVEDAAKEALDDIAAAGAETVGDELAKVSESFWQKEALQKHAMSVFREGLQALTEPDEDGGPTRRLILVVDELDRCRPDYALNMLETLKHVFAIPGVQFVLGVNMDALADSVRARYGNDYNAELYLQKFVQIEMKLRPTQPKDERHLVYFATNTAKKLNLSSNGLSAFIIRIIEHRKTDPAITLRGIQHLLRMTSVTPIPTDDWGNYQRYHISLVAGLMYIKSFYPHLVAKIRNRTVSWHEIEAALSPQDPLEASGYLEFFSVAWLLCFPEQRSDKFWSEYLGDRQALLFDSIHYETLLVLLEEFVDAFELT
jgi:hypothetical protein